MPKQMELSLSQQIRTAKIAKKWEDYIDKMTPTWVQDTLQRKPKLTRRRVNRSRGGIRNVHT